MQRHPELKESFSLFDFGAIVAAASLAHDLGNPPFGHAGEDAISDFFREHSLGRSYREKVTDAEWEDLIRAIRKDEPYNEVERGAKASLVTSMGRMAAHTGQVITFDEMLNCEHEFAPDADKLVIDGPAPIKAAANGRYPVPMPGIVTNREYA